MRGFTLIEIVVVVSIMVLLSAILIVYSRSGEVQLLLFKDQARVINAVLRAKNLAIQVFRTGEKICGYGVHFSPAGQFIIFKDLAEDCAASDNVYSGTAEDFSVSALDSNLRFSQLEISDILFVPPEPAVILTPARDGAVIVVGTADASRSVTIKVNNAGQVTAQ